MSDFRWKLSFVTVAIVGLIAQMAGVSATIIGKPGSPCKAINSKYQVRSAQNLVCVKSGKKLIWKISAVTAEALPSPRPSETPSPSPSQTVTPVVVISPSPSMSTPTVGLGINADCVALAIKFGLSKDSATPISQESGTSGTVGGLDAMSNCFKDTGITAVITSSPFNPTETASITKYRSCSGHDFAEGSADGQVLAKDPQYEKFSSMKHYIHPVKQNAGDATDVFAPFDGVVTKVGSDSGAQVSAKTYANAGRDIDFVPYSNPAVTFTYAHVYGISLKPGDVVTSGQKVGYHEVQSVNAGHSSYDIAMSKFDATAMRAMATKRLSMMNYLAPSVADLLAKFGLAPENSIWPAVYRAANPCVIVGNLGFFQGPENPADRVTLNH